MNPIYVLVMKFKDPKVFYKVTILNQFNRKRDDIIQLKSLRLPGGLTESSPFLKVKQFFEKRLKIIWDDGTPMKIVDAFIDNTIVSE